MSNEDVYYRKLIFAKLGNLLVDVITGVVFNILYATVGLVFAGGIFALFKAVSFKRVTSKASVGMSLTKDQLSLSNRQLSLLGLKPKVDHIVPDSSWKPPKATVDAMPTSEDLVPLHQPTTGSGSFLSSRAGMEQLSASGGSRSRPLSTPSKPSVASSSLYLVPGSISPLPAARHSPASVVSSPWSGKPSSREISSEEKLAQFLAEVDEKITESAGKMATPPPTIGGFVIASPNNVATPINSSGTTRSTPLRPVRMSPGSQKFTTPPKKGEGEFPPPMSLEESIKTFEQLGIYPEVESWRDCLRQWFSSVLLKPLLQKIETSHLQVF